MLAIPTHSVKGKFPSVSGFLETERPLNRPVVRKIELPPGLVIEGRLHKRNTLAEIALRSIR